jgi:hypothetical protein
MSASVRVGTDLYRALWGVYVEARDHGSAANRHAAVRRVQVAVAAEHERAMERYDLAQGVPATSPELLDIGRTAP